ncbi:hypothetical protein F4779DRAFT_637958 [Xylariaceae sp. FL0662B]|nr:hypothetical protein F4779DRAFT_637958 [Xylariaceae sp. FL0662B]
MGYQEKNLKAFLDSIVDEKLTDMDTNRANNEWTIGRDYDASYRLDHQGLNSDPKEHPYIHRLYVQPISGPGTRSKRGNNNEKNNSSVYARCHVTQEATPEQIREALMESYNNHANIGYAPKRSDGKQKQKPKRP